MHDNHKILFFIKLSAALIIMSIVDFIAFIVCIVTFFKGRNICRQYIVRPFSNFILSLFGISYRVHKTDTWSPGQKIYISNHTSTIDVFILCGLGLPNTRFFMSKVTRKFIPMTVILKC